MLNLGGKGSFKNILDIYYDYKKHIYKANFFFFTFRVKLFHHRQTGKIKYFGYQRREMKYRVKTH